jgi:AbrB family looped-hinge helix DNA binding protein
MTAVTISPKYQVVIPKTIRESMRLTPGMKLSVVEYQGKIQFIPLRPIEKLFGAARGLPEFKREKKDRQF